MLYTIIVARLVVWDLFHESVVSNTTSPDWHILRSFSIKLHWHFPPVCCSVTTQWSKTPLHVAASAGRADVAKLLILHGANIYATDNVGDRHWWDCVAWLGTCLNRVIVAACTIMEDQVNPRSNHINEALTSSGSLFGHVLPRHQWVTHKSLSIGDPVQHTTMLGIPELDVHEAFTWGCPMFRQVICFCLFRGGGRGGVLSYFGVVFSGSLQDCVDMRLCVGMFAYSFVSDKFRTIPDVWRVVTNCCASTIVPCGSSGKHTGYGSKKGFPGASVFNQNSKHI